MKLEQFGKGTSRIVIDQGASSFGLDFGVKSDDSQVVAMLIEQGSRFFMFDDIFGKPATRYKNDIEVKLPQEPPKEEEQEEESMSEQANLPMVVYNASEFAPTRSEESDDDGPVTKREFKEVKSTLAELVALLKKKDCIFFNLLFKSLFFVFHISFHLDN